MMDFALGERQQAVADLAAEVLGADRPPAADPWKELARAGLLDVSPPASPPIMVWPWCGRTRRGYG